MAGQHAPHLAVRGAVHAHQELGRPRDRRADGVPHLLGRPLQRQVDVQELGRILLRPLLDVVGKEGDLVDLLRLALERGPQAIGVRSLERWIPRFRFSITVDVIVTILGICQPAGRGIWIDGVFNELVQATEARAKEAVP
eukprot:8567577-Pyramimonas_sp.AAC.1